jgi:hypothetical protein
MIHQPGLIPMAGPRRKSAASVANDVTLPGGEVDGANPLGYLDDPAAEYPPRPVR